METIKNELIENTELNKLIQELSSEVSKVSKLSEKLGAITNTLYKLPTMDLGYPIKEEHSNCRIGDISNILHDLKCANIELDNYIDTLSDVI